MIGRGVAQGGLLACLTAAWLLGVVGGAVAGELWWPALAGIATAGVVAAVAERNARLALLGLLAAGLFAGGSLRYIDQQPTDHLTGIALHNGASVRFRAVVSEEPDVQGRSQRLRLSARELFTDGAWQPTSGGVVLRTGLFPRHQYGDLLDIEGKLETPPAFPDFDYRDYLAQRGIGSIITYPSVRTIGAGQGSAAIEQIGALRNRLGGALARVLPEPQAALAQGILLGQRASIPQSLNDDMNATGTSHLIAISGQNVSLVAALMIAALAWLIGRRRAALVALIAIGGYTVLTGASPSVVRAAIMGALFVIATLAGRPASAATSIALAAAIMTGVDPQVIHDVSFQLSFAAIIGLVYLTPSLQQHGAALLGRAGIDAGGGGVASFLLESLSVTAGAVAATMPLIALQFGRFSAIAPVPNLLLVPIFPLIMVSSAVTAGATLAWEPLGRAIGWLAWLPLTFMVKTVSFFASVPLASIHIGDFGRWHAAGAYVALAAIAWWLARRRPDVAARPAGTAFVVRPALVLASGLAVAAAFAWWSVLPSHGDRLTVSVLDVGQGDAILVETPDGHHVLIDGGPSGLTLAQRLGDELPFWERTIDLVALTHPQEDHVVGLIEALDRYDANQVLASPASSDSAAYRAWRDLIAREHLPYYEARDGEQIALGGGAMLQVLGPTADALTDGNPNDASLVLKLTWRNVSFLLTGDMETGAEEALLRSGVDLHATVLKVAHHGSSTSTSTAFLHAVSPRVAVISVGANNSFHQPSPEVIDRLHNTLVLRTDENGTVRLSTDGEHLWVEPERRP